MSAFIYLSTGSNSSVGFIQGINGIMQVCQKRCMSPMFGEVKQAACSHSIDGSRHVGDLCFESSQGLARPTGSYMPSLLSHPCR